jgi:hypothetical protein
MWRILADFHKSRNNQDLLLDFDNTNTKQGVRKFGAWNRELVMLLRKLISRLGSTVDAWERFREKDIGYFLLDDELPTTASLLECSVNAVDNVFRDLKAILRKLRELKDELCHDSPQGVSDFYFNPEVEIDGLLSESYILGLIETA